MITTKSTVNGAHGVPATAVAGITIDADTLLQASRRIDWRFLLPDPELGRVICLGSLPDSLLESLRLFSHSLNTLALEAAQDAPAAQADLVVVRQLTPDKLRLAVRHLRPGGYLYAEMEGLLSPKRPRPPWKQARLATPPGCITAVAGAGFVDVVAYWHWPNFASCTRIIPLDDRGALQHAFVNGGRSAKARLQAVAGQGLLQSGLLVHIVPRFSVVARLKSS